MKKNIEALKRNAEQGSMQIHRQLTRKKVKQTKDFVNVTS